MSTVRPCARRQQMSPSIAPSPSAPHPVEPDRIFELLIAPIFAASTLSLLLIPPRLYIMTRILHRSLSSYVVPRAGMRQVLVKGDRSSLRAGFLFGMSCLADHWDTPSLLDRCSACFAFSSLPPTSG